MEHAASQSKTQIEAGPIREPRFPVYLETGGSGMGVRIVGDLGENGVDVGADKARKIVHRPIQGKNLAKSRT